jgi:hypothetical protein
MHMQVSGRTKVERLVLDREVSSAIAHMLTVHGVKPTLITLKGIRLPSAHCQQRIEAGLKWVAHTRPT